MFGVGSKIFKTSAYTATAQLVPSGGGFGLPALLEGPTLGAEYAPLACDPSQDSQAGLCNRHTHVQATPTWNTPAITPAMTMTAGDTPLLRYTVTHQEFVETNRAVHTPRHHVDPRSAHTHKCPAKLSGRGHRWRLWPEWLA